MNILIVCIRNSLIVVSVVFMLYILLKTPLFGFVIVSASVVGSYFSTIAWVAALLWLYQWVMKKGAKQ